LLLETHLLQAATAISSEQIDVSRASPLGAIVNCCLNVPLRHMPHIGNLDSASGWQILR